MNEWFGETKLLIKDNGQHTFERSRRNQGGSDFARFNPSDDESIIGAAKYVGSSEKEIKLIQNHFNL